MKIILKGGTELTPEQAAEALEQAMQIIEAVGTTGIHARVQAAQRWMEKYFPN